MPFGGSSCTSLAQRQSDAIRLVATVDLDEATSNRGGGTQVSIREILPIRRVCSTLLPMLDDFLGVLPRRVGETDEEILLRAQEDVKRFDTLLENLRLPEAPEKIKYLHSPQFGTGLSISAKSVASECRSQSGRN